MVDDFNAYKEQYTAQKKKSASLIKPEAWTRLAKTFGIIAGAALLLFLICSTFMFTVDEREQVIITQFDEIVRVIVDDPNDPSILAMKEDPRFKDVVIESGKGLFLKVPFIQNVERYTNMYLTYDTTAEEVFTKDKKKILLDNFAQWKIYNPALFMVNMGNYDKANQTIDEYIYSMIREEIGKIEAHTLIADKAVIAEMMQRIEVYVNSQLEPLGIQVLDVRIKRTEYLEETKPSIYEQMRSERAAVATQYRADGEKLARTIRAEANKEATVIEADAYEKSQKIIGEGDAEALSIYAEAYNLDPEFYSFFKTLQTYQSIIGTDTTIIIDPNSELAHYLYNP